MTKKAKRKNQKLRSEGLSNLCKDTQWGSWGAAVGVFIFPHEAKSLLYDENIQWPRGWLQHGAVPEGPDGVKNESESRSVVPDSSRPHGLYSPWSSPGQNTGVGSLSLLQGIFPPKDWTQVSRSAGGFFTSWAATPGELRAETQIGICPLTFTADYSQKSKHGSNPSVHWRMKGEAECSSCIQWKIIFSLKKEGDSDTRHSMDEPWG